MRRLNAPEILQTSAMDCGPASLCSALQGLGTDVSYERLRELCQTDVDGTSIDTLEEIAQSMGVDAEQVMLPPTSVRRSEARAVPAIVLVRLPDGMPHFVVIWRSVGPLVQIMDPASGRRWTTWRALLAHLYIHSTPVPAAAWRAWAGSEENTAVLRRRLADAGLGRRAGSLLDAALQDPSWRTLARLDAALSLAETLVSGRSLRAGRATAQLVEHLAADEERAAAIPADLWQVRAMPAPAGDEPQVLLRGAVLVRLAASGADRPAGATGDLASLLRRPRLRPLRRLLALLRDDGAFSLAGLGAAIALAAGGAIFEALLLRGILEAGRELGLPTQRLSAVAFVGLFAVGFLLLEWRIAQGLLRLGRHLEVRLRRLFLAKIPRLPDRYFQSRPVSDLAERAHAIHGVRGIGVLGGRLLQATASLLVTTLAIAWVDPPSATLAVAGIALMGLSTLALRPVFQAVSLKLQTHAGALGSFYLDVLIGLRAVRSHRAERTIMREHERRMVEWCATGRRALHAWLLCNGLLSATGYGAAFAIVYGFASRDTDPARGLLLAFWALQLPRLGNEVANLARELPGHQVRVGRLLEPLDAAEDDAPAGPEGTPPDGGVCIELRKATCKAGGHLVLDDVDLRIGAGEHVAVVGPSGAGKSSLVGILLGWSPLTDGTVSVDGAPLTPGGLDRLRRETVWIDPSVQLWNQPMLDNLRYGADTAGAERVAAATRDADLLDVLETLPAGLQTGLGEGGGLLSGGEGQRVRIGRGLMRPDARLVILDEAFRGLDRERRDRLLRRLRDFWPRATLLCVTHDVEQAMSFDRVLVVDAGKIAEDGDPAALAAQAGSKFATLRDAGRNVVDGLYGAATWRRLHLEHGALRDGEVA